MDERLVDVARRCLAPVIEREGLSIPSDDTPGVMGGASVEIEHPEATILIERDRGGSPPGVMLKARDRVRPGARRRGAWISQIRAFLDGSPDARACHLSEDLDWLVAHWNEVMSSAFLNADELRAWQVRASRRLFG